MDQSRNDCGYNQSSVTTESKWKPALNKSDSEYIPLFLLLGFYLRGCSMYSEIHCETSCSASRVQRISPQKSKRVYSNCPVHSGRGSRSANTEVRGVAQDITAVVVGSTGDRKGTWIREYCKMRIYSAAAVDNITLLIGTAKPRFARNYIYTWKTLSSLHRNACGLSFMVASL